MNSRYELRDGVAIITLDRPDKLNALTVEIREDLGTHFETAGRDPAMRAVLLQATDKAFCASSYVSKMVDFTAESGRALLKLAHRMVSMDLTRFRRHISASSTKLLECQRANCSRSTRLIADVRIRPRLI